MSDVQSVDRFRSIVEYESKTLESLCEKWSEILEETTSHSHDSNEGGGNVDELDPEELFGSIRSTIGQAKLLMSQRFKQFSQLIDNCEFNTGQHPTRLDDLAGFWEMISYQVEDVQQKFKHLDQMFQYYRESLKLP